MAKHLRKQNSRLTRRQNKFVSNPKERGSTHLAGSMNPHKSAPKGAGKRPRTSVKADSQAATS